MQVNPAGVNFWEVMQRRGLVPPPASGVPGTEGAGTEVGAGVNGLRPGTRVAWSKVPGSYSSEVIGPADAFTVIPDELDDDAAASVLFQRATAAYLAQETWQVQKGDPVVVTAASGGVGLLLTQLLAARGAHVVGVISSMTKADAVIHSGGASHVLTYAASIAARVRDLYPDGVAAVYDAIGSGVAEPLVGALRARERGSSTALPADGTPTSPRKTSPPAPCS